VRLAPSEIENASPFGNWSDLHVLRKCIPSPLAFVVSVGGNCILVKVLRALRFLRHIGLRSYYSLGSGRSLIISEAIMSQQISDAPDTVGLSIAELFKEPLRPVTRERQRQLLAVSSIVLLVTFSVATVPEHAVTPIGGLKIYLARPGLLVALTITLLVYLLTVFALDSFHDLYASWLATQVAANLLAKKPREFVASVYALTARVRDKQEQLRTALAEATRSGNDDPFAKEIKELNERRRSISDAIGEDLNNSELWEEWASCDERLAEVYRKVDAEHDKKSVQFASALKELNEATSDAPDSAQARIAYRALRVFPSVRFLTVLFEVGIPVLLSLGAIWSVFYRFA